MQVADLSQLGDAQGMLLSKMVILPVFGIAFVQSLSAHTTLYPKEDKMLRFVAMLLVRASISLHNLTGD